MSHPFRPTLAAALMATALIGSFALPALAQGGAQSGVSGAAPVVSTQAAKPAATAVTPAPAGAMATTTPATTTPATTTPASRAAMPVTPAVKPGAAPVATQAHGSQGAPASGPTSAPRTN